MPPAKVSFQQQIGNVSSVTYTTNVIVIVAYLDISLKLSLVILSVFLLGIEVTLIWTFLFVILLMVPNYVYYNEYYKNDETSWFWYSAEIFHLVLTNLSFEMEFEAKDSKHFKLREVANRFGLYIIFLFGLCATTWYMQEGQNGCFAKSLAWEEAKNNSSIILRNEKLSCGNLCHAPSSLDCSKPVLTLSDVRNWMYVNWGIFIICAFRLLNGKYKGWPMVYKTLG